MVKQSRKKWTSCVILESMLDEVKKYCKNSKNGFANTSQFVVFAVRKELDFRKGKKQ